MKDKSICPICGKAGLPNIYDKQVICPQCNSDLTAFHLIRKITGKATTNRVLFLIVALFVLFIILFYSMNSSKVNQLEKDKKQLAGRLTILSDSIKHMNLRMTNNEPAVKTERNRFNYIVKRGDNLWDIAYKFYGDGFLYSQIQQENNMKDKYELNPGQRIYIPIISE